MEAPNDFGWTLVSQAIPKTSIMSFSDDSNVIARLINSFSLAIAQQSTESNQIDPINGKNSFLAYWLSPFSMMCMITALIMNRIIIFASSRRNRKLPMISNIILRSFSIFLLFKASLGLIMACKSYLDNPVIQFIFQSRIFDFDPIQFPKLSFLSIPFGEDHFYKVLNGKTVMGPTTSILRPFHLSLCLSQVLETFISVASGSRPAIETGITLFEYSLAFQEATPFQFPVPQLLYVGLIAFVNQLNIHLLGLFNIQKYRLIPSSIIGSITLGYYIYNLIIGEIIRMPFIIIIGYFPHFCIIVVIIISYLIYISTAIFRWSFQDLTMTSLVTSLNLTNISLGDDFYTALILYGEFIINVSIHQSYVEEISSINLPIDNFIEVNGYSHEVNSHPDLLNLKIDHLNQKMNGTIRKKVNSMNLIIQKLFILLRIRIFGSQHGVNVILTNETRDMIKKQINLNLIDEDELELNYANLILNRDFTDIDESPDYDLDEDFNEIQEESETEDLEGDDPFRELINPNDFQEVIASKGENERILNYHMRNMDNNSSALTRSHFAEYYDDDLRLVDLIKERRPFNHSIPVNEAEISNPLGVCVICHTNSRQVILWPCKCLAVCESCRVALSLREFRSCVCCRQKVEAFSKVFVP